MKTRYFSNACAQALDEENDNDKKDIKMWALMQRRVL